MVPLSVVLYYFKITKGRAKEMILRMEHAISHWRETGQALGMMERELDQFAEAFKHPEREAARRAQGDLGKYIADFVMWRLKMG